jgi:predicted AAA+ superfamily ATPase
MAESLSPLRNRRLLPILKSLSAVEPVIALHGPRSVGKSTLLGAFAAGAGVPVIDLDDQITLAATLANPTLSISGPPPVCLDEYQKAPDSLAAIKVRLTREGTLPGTAVLTGSTRQDAVPRTAQALPGRIHVMTILPLSQGEIGDVTEDLLPALFADPVAAVAAHPMSFTTRDGYVQRLCAGGFPLALRRSGSSRDRWFADYVRVSLERDAPELVKIRQRQVLRSLLATAAGRTAQPLNISALTEALGANRETIEGYLRLLEDLFLLFRLPAWGTTLRARATKHPKIHVLDSGLAAHLMRITPAKLASLDPTVLTEFGHLLETFVVGELRKQVSWLAAGVATGHWRTADGDEVDFVIEDADGRVIAFDVKANERVSGGELGGLRKLREALRDRFVAGVALSTGPRSFTYEDRVHVLPIDRLWRPTGL